MKPISVHNAKPGEPWTMTCRHDGAVTVADLLSLFVALERLGHGGTAVVFSDKATGLHSIRRAQLFDTTEEQTRGETHDPMTFILT